MIRLSDYDLRRRAMLGAFDKGWGYYKLGRVREVRTTANYDYFIANVYGSSIYETNVKFNIYGDIEETSCTCPAHVRYTGDCKHITALLLTIREYINQGKIDFKKPEGELKNIIQQYRDQIDTQLIQVNLGINCEMVNGEFFVNLKIGEDKLYVVKNIGKFLNDVMEEREIEFGKNFTYYPNIHGFHPIDREILDFFGILYENHEINHYNYYGKGNSIFSGKNLELAPKSLDRFLQLVKGRTFNLKYNDIVYEDIYITDEKLDLNFIIEEHDNDLILRMGEELDLGPISEDGKYFFYRDKIYILPKEQRLSIMPLWSEMENKDSNIIKINNDLKEAFISEVLPRIKKHTTISIDEKVEESIYNPGFHGTVYFDRQDEVILGKVIFNYGEININPFSSKENKVSEKILLRDIESERAIMSLLEQGDFKVSDGGFYLEDEEQIFDFINDIIPKLQRYCEIYYSENFKRVGFLSQSNVKAAFKLSERLDMLQFDFEIEGIVISELSHIFNALKEKKKYYKLRDGSFLSLDNKEFNDVLNMFDTLDIDIELLKEGNIQIPKFRTLYLDNLIKDRGMDFIKRNVDFKRLVRDINEPDDTEYNIPESLTAELRDYQKFGFKWLKTLSKYGFGGILADEMGLGKTIQIIAFLLSEKIEKGPEPSIVIVPTSLVYNWEEEVKRFAKDLKTLVIIGSKNERDSLIKTIGDYDLIITTYPLIRRDIIEYMDYTFRYCILDEAQHIKNHVSINAKSVKNIKAKNRFALTGTPMENSLSELWSIFDFLMPGYLYTSGKFSERYEKQMARVEDHIVLKELNYHIRPFILRRLKKDVLRELPDKIEQKIVVDMTKEQKKLYLAYLASIKGELDDEIKTMGYNKSHIKILAGLTRLRQICCHPSVFLENYNGGSGKLDSLEEIVSEALDGGHRILIFSQFTSMLEKIREKLELNNISCMYLDGNTPVIERGHLVRDFNKGKGDIFLISLKAGGTGLNLTSADMVIHFDPWWNPAVEDQATDRAHRIGQENKVQVIKLITKGTIEEKIFKIQEKKKEMIDKVITEGETLITKLSEEEIMSLFDM